MLECFMHTTGVEKKSTVLLSCAHSEWWYAWLGNSGTDVMGGTNYFLIGSKTHCFILFLFFVFWGFVYLFLLLLLSLLLFWGRVSLCNSQKWNLLCRQNFVNLHFLYEGSACTAAGQKRMSDPILDSCEPLCGCWESDSVLRKNNQCS